MTDEKRLSPQETEVDIREYLSVLWRGKWIVIAITIVALFLGLILIYTLPPVYEAEAKVLIVEVNPANDMFGDEYGIQYSTSREVNFHTQLQILASRQFKEEVVEELALEIRPEKLDDKVTVARVGGNTATTMTNIISVKVQDEDPELAADIANSLSKNYIDWSEETYQENLNTLLSDISTKLQVAKENLDSISLRIQDLEESGRTVTESLKKELELASNMYAMLSENYENLKISRSLRNSGAKLIETALVPQDPIKPNKRLFLLSSFLIGLVLSVGVVFAREFFDNTIKTSDDVKKYYGLNVISQIAYDKASDKKLRELVLLKSPNSLTSESLKELRTNIGYFNIDKKLKTIAITSAQLEEGKTFISANLAVALAQSGKKILLVNADFRKPVLHKYFSHNNRSGITNILTGYTELADEIVATPVDKLFFLASGPIPPNPSELLESEAMGALLESLSKKFDYIIIDTPPIVPVTDTIVLANRLDAIIIVARSAKVTRALAREASAKLEPYKKKVLGVVLNGVVRKGSYYYYYK